MAKKNYLNFVLKYDQYSNLKGMEKKKKLLASLLMAEEDASTKILLMHVSSNQ